MPTALPEADQLEAAAVALGASGARVIDAGRIVVRDALARVCLDPGCPSYGLSASCPPHVAGPSGFRELVARSTHALVVVLEVETGCLLGEERREVFALLHEIVSGSERRAAELGLGSPRAFAGGSCRLLFCSREADCAVVAGRACRNPDLARPSMSGHGVDVQRLVEAAGFELRRAVRQEDGVPAPGTSPVVGLVLFAAGGPTAASRRPPR